MQPLIECVPNFSEGRRPEVVAQIVATISALPGIVLLDHSMDADHNRAVVTFAGDAGAVAEAAFRACAVAARLIDLETQRGAHPRIGATDVIPFIPLQGASPADCVALARRLGERIGRELALPVYLYAEAATREANRKLADVRRGEYERLKHAIETDPARAPDFGPRRLGPAGAVAIGVRGPLIAFNVNLAGADINIAKAIARTVRASSGGLPAVTALGFALSGPGLVQVSMNLTDYRQTSLFRAFDAVQREAERHGAHIVESELIGLIPLGALVEPDAHAHPTNSTSMQAGPMPGSAPLLATGPAPAPPLVAEPNQAFLDTVARRLHLPALTRDQVLELRLADALRSPGQPLPERRDDTAPASDVQPTTSHLGHYSTPSYAPPADSTLSDLPPADSAPSDAPPADSTPSDLPPADSTPSDVPPINSAPSDVPLGDSTSSDVQSPPADFLAALAAATPAPAGGSAAAYAGALAAALVTMVAGLTLAKKSYAAVHDEMRAIHAAATSLQAALSAAVAADARAYGAVMDAYKLAKDSPARAPAVQRAMRGAALASIRVAEQSARVLALARSVRAKGLKTARSDSTVAIYLAEASARGALLNAKENVSLLTDEALVGELLGRIVAAEEEVRLRITL